MSSTDSEPQQEQQHDWDEWSDDEGSGFRPLFEPDRAMATLQEALAHDAAQHGFDLRQFRVQRGLDHYDTLRLINWVRGEVAAGRDPRPALSASGGGGDAAAPWADDRFLTPVLPDDELLFHDWEEDDAEAGTGVSDGDAAGAAAAAGGSGCGSAELAKLREENAALRAAVEALQSVVLADDAVRELVADAAAAAGASDSGQGSNGSGPSTSAAAAGGTQQQQQQSEAALIDQSYFESYSTWHIHRDMLADRARTEAYREALEKNPGLIRGARVLDVGCGTGILSMFAARGGAAAVVGVDGSAPIAAVARANVAHNGLAAEAGGPIAIVSSKVEELTALPLPGSSASAGDASQQPEQQPEQQQQRQQQVDVLVSEWMGYALFFESMLDSVIAARDRFLRPGGAVLPDSARIYLAPAAAGAVGTPFWADVYGFAMPAVAEGVRSAALREVVVHVVKPEDILGEGEQVASFDLATMSAADQDFTADFRLAVSRGPAACEALVLWFDTLFTQRFCAEHPVDLSTSPFAAPTHWGQAVLALAAPVTMAPASGLAQARGDGSSGSSAAVGSAEAPAVALAGRISMARSKHRHRSLDIALSYRAVGADGRQGEEVSSIYAMGVSS